MLDEFEGSRVDVVLESDVFAEINYIPFHEAEGYGFFKHMQDLNETPGSRDIVLYDALPNSLPRVGGNHNFCYSNSTVARQPKSDSR
jgi:hypothetical protein